MSRLGDQVHALPPNGEDSDGGEDDQENAGEIPHCRLGARELSADPDAEDRDDQAQVGEEEEA